MSENKSAPVAWRDVDLDGMCEAFSRCIEAQHHKDSPFHSPINADAMTALRILRGLLPAMKALAAPAPVAQASEFEAWYDTVVKYVEPADIAAWMRDAWDAGRASALRSAQAQNDNPSKWERNGYF